MNCLDIFYELNKMNYFKKMKREKIFELLSLHYNFFLQMSCRQNVSPFFLFFIYNFRLLIKIFVNFKIL